MAMTITIPLDYWRELRAAAIDVDVEDICDKCNDDEKYGDSLCIACLEEELEEDEDFL